MVGDNANSHVNVNDKQFHKAIFTVKGGQCTASVDGKAEAKFPNCGSETTDEALCMKQSYFWLRGNNDDHGRIYIYAKTGTQN